MAKTPLMNLINKFQIVRLTYIFAIFLPVWLLSNAVYGQKDDQQGGQCEPEKVYGPYNICHTEEITERNYQYPSALDRIDLSFFPGSAGKIKAPSSNSGTFTIVWDESFHGEAEVNIFGKFTETYGNCKRGEPQLIRYKFVRLTPFSYEFDKDFLEGPSGVMYVEDGSESVTLNYTFTVPKAAEDEVDYIQTYIDGEKQSRTAPGNFSLKVPLGDHDISVNAYNKVGCKLNKVNIFRQVSILPSCAKSTGVPLSFTLSGPDIEKDTEYKITKGEEYTLEVTGIFDFDSHYEFKHDGGNAVSLLGNKFSIDADIGSFRFEALRKDNRDVCPVVEPLHVFLDGHDLVLEHEHSCLITIPDDFESFGITLKPGEPALEHFAATVKSRKGIIIKPGITLSLGAEMILDYEEPQIDPERELNADMNFIQTTAYDEYGYVLGQSRKYFDNFGRATQSQYKNLTEDVLMTSEVVYDASGRAVLNTLAAPTKTGTFAERDDECGDRLQTGAKVQFEYKSNFITGLDNQPYDHTKFDGAMEMTPEAVGNSKPGTLGWYYSANNGSSADEKMNEPLVASTSYPYSRTIFHHDGTEDVKTTSIPGDAFRIGGGNLGETDKEAVTDADLYLKDYFKMRKDELDLDDPEIYNGKFFKTVNEDAHGYSSVGYQDLSGNTIISLYFGDQNTPITRTYQFYNARGQLIVSLSPNGWEQYSIDNIAFEAIDKTTYSYNVKGRLIETDGIDAGRSEFIYRRDGSIRFSQNAEQRKTGRYSYTNYDWVGRPIESGEYVPGPEGVKFGREHVEMQNILEHIGPDGGLSSELGDKQDQVYTFYDFPDNNLPVYREQQFVNGAVSYTKNENVTVWYSYDEQGRIDWMVQEIVGLGIKTADYRYGPTGNVIEVTYQKTDSDEDFYHYYKYDADGRLSKVYTATDPLEYDQFGELTNPEILSQQALYDYYLHGPLKRIELADRLQGIDYIYTASGALKGINSGDPERDPGEDNDNDEIRDDVFGMTLDYYANDYSSPGFDDYSLSLADNLDIEEQYTGNIRAQSWYSPVDHGKMRTYAYRYDNRNQLANATWGSILRTGSKNDFIYNFMPHEKSAFNENIPEYDLNGNIKYLNRNDTKGNALANFDYEYKGNTNQLSQIKNGDELFREYDYNAIGQLSTQTLNNTKQFVKYDVSGKVLGVYKEKAYDKPIVEYIYDDRGFRLSALRYKGSDKGTVAETRTWYVRDASGQLLSVYSEDLYNKAAPKQTEIPLYGSGRLGLYRPNSLMGQYQYELTDHLGNVRAVIGKGTTLTYLATMESERGEKEKIKEKGYFSNLKSSATSGSINHTPKIVTVDDESGETEVIENPNEVDRINNGCDTCTENPIGTGIMLPVSPGDVIKMEVFAKYANFDKSNSNLIPLAEYLISAFGLPTEGESWMSIFDIVEEPWFLTLVEKETNTDYPRAYLNYILYDNNYNFEGLGVDQVGASAKIPDDNPHLHSHQKLSKEVLIEQPGYIYIYVSNEDKQDMDVYFDDLKVTHELSDIVAGSDYYPFGLKMDGREITREDFRFGYQGQFAEEDEETGWNSFELRMYDPVIGRWMVTDPAGQYYSSYVGMGNNPASLVDPDGAFSKFGAWWRNGFAMDGVYEAGGEWGYSKSFTYTDVSDFGTLTGVGHEFIYQDAFSGNVAAYAWNSPIARYYFPDFVNIGAGFNGIAGVGGYTNFDLQWVTRGPEASWYPAVTVTQAVGGGFSVDATVNIGGMNYLGSVQDISRSMLQTNTAQGDFPTIWGSVGIAAGAKIGIEGSYTPTRTGFGLIGRQLIIGGGLPLGTLPLNGSGGVSNTFIIHDFY